MQRIVFETSPAFILVCLLIGIGYAYLLYSNKHPWSLTINRFLFVFRLLLAFILSFFLLGPIIKQVLNVYEKPVFAVVYDNSTSISEVVSKEKLNRVQEAISNITSSLAGNGFDAATFDLQGDPIDTLQFQATRSDLHTALRKVSSRYEGRNIAGVVLISDGIYNEGLSPVYASYNFPIYTVGIGDTTTRSDIAIKDIIYNKVAYQGNKFPIRVEVLVRGIPNQPVWVTLSHKGKVLDRKINHSQGDQLLVYDFLSNADVQGIQRYDIQVEVKSGELNEKNNRATAFVEVVEGKKKIALVAASPHPDIKAMRSVIEKNTNYELLLYIPGMNESGFATQQPDVYDLVIFHQSPDSRGRTRELFQKHIKSKTPLFFILGQQSDLSNFQSASSFLKFDQLPRQYDEVTPVISPAFDKFIISTDAHSMFATFPPVSVHFGKVQIASGAIPLLVQKVGSLTTDKPLLSVFDQDGRKVALLMGEGIWRWRLHEYSKSQNTQAFDELFGKLIQYLSTKDDKSRFKSYPIEQEFSDSEPVIFESQVYNDIYEPIFGNLIDIEITNEAGVKTTYQYAINPGNTRYQIGGLSEGVYKYKSTTVVNGKSLSVFGQFLITAQQTELQNLTADFSLMRTLATNTGGRFYTTEQVASLQQDFQLKKASSIIKSEETYDSIINLKWIFLVLLLMVSTEWFLRKFFGGY
jgi:hypothetical protein